MDYRILVPSGIGDFSWLWSKLVTTPHNFHIDYMGGKPDRLAAFLSLLPKDRVLSFKANIEYATSWNSKNALAVHPNFNGVAPVRTATRLRELSETELCFFECNTHLEHGRPLSDWLKDEIPKTNYHYEIAGTLKKYTPGNYFIVNYSSYGTKKAWGYYEVPDAAEVVRMVAQRTGWVPLFVGGTYDDFTQDVYTHLKAAGEQCVSLIGKTPTLVEVIALLQQSRMYFGACSGLMVLANVFNVPVITYYPPFEKAPGRYLSGMWHDPKTFHLGLFWEGKEKDIAQIELAFDYLAGEIQ